MNSRTKILIGDENYQKIERSNILIVGIGGVGGYVVESLVRSGVLNLTIIDKDIIDISNLNRQIVTNINNVGQSKVDAFRERILSINPKVNLNCLNISISLENIDELRLDEYDYIVDAIDDVTAKAALIKKCQEKNKKIVVATGSARRLHPEKLFITTLDKTSYDPLAKKLRMILRKEKVSLKVPCIASTEIPLDNKENSLGSIAFVPGVAGLLISSYIINDLIKM